MFSQLTSRRAEPITRPPQRRAALATTSIPDAPPSRVATGIRVPAPFRLSQYSGHPATDDST